MRVMVVVDEAFGGREEPLAYERFVAEGVDTHLTEAGFLLTRYLAPAVDA